MIRLRWTATRWEKPPLMCRLFGHIWCDGWFGDRPYFRPEQGPVDGIGKHHVSLKCRCDRCDAQTVVGYVHDWLVTDKADACDAIAEKNAKIAGLQRQLDEMRAELDACCGARDEAGIFPASPSEAIRMLTEDRNAAEAERDRLAAENERLKDRAQSVVFHYFNCDGLCGDLRPSIARLAKETGYSDRAVNDEIDAAIAIAKGAEK